MIVIIILLSLWIKSVTSSCCRCPRSNIFEFLWMQSMFIILFRFLFCLHDHPLFHLDYSIGFFAIQVRRLFAVTFIISFQVWVISVDARLELHRWSGFVREVRDAKSFFVIILRRSRDWRIKIRLFFEWIMVKVSILVMIEVIIRVGTFFNWRFDDWCVMRWWLFKLSA